jgi:hypothetical protein
MDDGGEEEIPFEYILGDPRNIGRGEVRYSAAAGLRRETAPSPACYEYIIEEPAASADVLYGLARTVSVGLSGLSSRHNNIAGTQVLWDMGFLGWLDMRGAASYTAGADIPYYGGRIDASYLPNIGLGIRKLNRMLGGDIYGNGPLPGMSLSLRGFYMSETYNSDPFKGEAITSNALMGGISGNIGFGFFMGGISGSGAINFYRVIETNADDYYPIGYSYGARISQSIYRIPISVSAGMSVYGGVHRPYFSMSMSHGFGFGAGVGKSIGGHQISASAGIGVGMGYDPLVLKPVEYPDSIRLDPNFTGPEYEFVMGDSAQLGMGGNASLNWSWRNDGNGVGAQHYSASVVVPDIFDPHIPGLRAGFSHTYNRAFLSGSYSLMDYSTSVFSSQTHTLSATLAGSFMFADGLWAFGRPTYGSFALIEAKHGMKGTNIHVGRSSRHNQDFSRNGWLGAAYDNRIGEHFSTPLSLTLTDIPVGVMLENNRFYTESGTRQGYALRLGGKQGVLMIARIRSAGRPVTYTFATIESESPRAGEPYKYSTFTGGDGTLQVGDLTPGATYRIKFAQSANIRDVLITIPRNADLLFEAGVIEVDRVVD